MILNQKVQEGVFWVRSLEEARGILFSAETSVIKTFIFTLFIEAWVFGANFLLKILKYLFFRQRFYSREEFSNIVIYTVGIVGDNVVMLPALTLSRCGNYSYCKLPNVGPQWGNRCDGGISL
jgi:hypothetical protein